MLWIRVIFYELKLLWLRVIIAVDRSVSQWSKRCLSHADLVLIVAMADKEKEVRTGHLIERKLQTIL